MATAPACRPLWQEVTATVAAAAAARLADVSSVRPTPGGLAVLATRHPAAWSGRFATEPVPLEQVQQLLVHRARAGPSAREVDVAVAWPPSRSAPHSPWRLWIAGSGNATRPIVDAAPPFGAVALEAAPLVVAAVAGEGGGGPPADLSGHAALATVPTMSALELWQDGHVRTAWPPYHADLVAAAPQRASVHLYAATALELWLAAVDTPHDPVLFMNVERVDWWTADAVLMAGPAARAVVTVAGETVRRRYVALVDVADAQAVTGPVTRLRCYDVWEQPGAGGAGAAAGLTGLPRCQLDAAPHAVLLGRWDGVADWPTAGRGGAPHCTAVTPWEGPSAVQECLARLLAAGDADGVVVVLRDANDPAAAARAPPLRPEFVRRFVTESVSYIPLVVRAADAPLDAATDAPLRWLGVDDAPAWDLAALPYLVTTAEALLSVVASPAWAAAASRLPAGRRLLALALALRARNHTVLRVEHPGRAAPPLGPAGSATNATPEGSSALGQRLLDDLLQRRRVGVDGAPWVADVATSLPAHGGFSEALGWPKRAVPRRPRSSFPLTATVAAARFFDAVGTRSGRPRSPDLLSERPPAGAQRHFGHRVAHDARRPGGVGRDLHRQLALPNQLVCKNCASPGRGLVLPLTRGHRACCPCCTGVRRLRGGVAKLFSSTAAGDAPVAGCTFSIFSNGVCRIRLHPPQPVRPGTFTLFGPASTGKRSANAVALPVATAMRAGGRAGGARADRRDGGSAGLAGGRRCVHVHRACVKGAVQLYRVKCTRYKAVSLFVREDPP